MKKLQTHALELEWHIKRQNHSGLLQKRALVLQAHYPAHMSYTLFLERIKEVFVEASHTRHPQIWKALRLRYSSWRKCISAMMGTDDQKESGCFCKCDLLCDPNAGDSWQRRQALIWIPSDRHHWVYVCSWVKKYEEVTLWVKIKQSP